MSSEPRIIVALDYPSMDQALELVDRLDPGLCRLKVGKELFTREGPQAVRTLQDRGFDVFLDLKFHDIPATVAKACAAAIDLGVWMLNVHALGGLRMLQEARRAVEHGSTKLIAVTILTSMDNKDLAQVGINNDVENQVLRLADLVAEAGLDGVVCSAKEASILRSRHPRFELITPGIRPSWSSHDDQKRIVTPLDALNMGVDYLVIGRPITQADNPQAALDRIHAEILTR